MPSVDDAAENARSNASEVLHHRVEARGRSLSRRGALLRLLVTAIVCHSLAASASWVRSLILQ